MYKKLLTILTGLLFLGALPAFSQDDEELVEEYLKPDYGMLSVEYRFSPFDDTNILAIENLRMRYFIDYNLALRGGPTLEFNNFKPTDSLKANGLKIGLNAGLEFHLEGTKRLSPYFGFEFFFVSQSYKTEDTNSGTTTEVKGIGFTDEGTLSAFDFTSPDFTLLEQGYFDFGGTGIVGFDLYLAKNFYLGGELGLNFTARSFSDIEVTVDGTAATPIAGGSQIRLGLDANNLIRLGYVF